MSITATGWLNKKGTADRTCRCGTWKQHWINFTQKTWPACCSVEGCSNIPTLGAHVINANVPGEQITPMCNPCNQLASTFRLKGSVTLPSADMVKTCG